jgi:hypothetical protein
MRDLSVAPSALETAVTAVKGKKRVTDQVSATREAVPSLRRAHASARHA